MSRRSLAVLFVGIVLFVVGCGSPSQSSQDGSGPSSGAARRGHADRAGARAHPR